MYLLKWRPQIGYVGVDLPLILVNVKFLLFHVLVGSGLAQPREISRFSAGDQRLL